MLKRLPYKTFLKTFAYVPRVGVSLFILNKKKEVLLTKRAKEPCANTWHLPGSFLTKGEIIDHCIERICKDELGVFLKDHGAVLAIVSEDIDQDPRGHVIDLIYKITVASNIFSLVNDTKEIQFFTHLPDAIGFNHRDALHRLGFAKSRA